MFSIYFYIHYTPISYTANDIPLNDHQLTQIEKVITSKNPIKRTPKSLDEMNDSQSITYTFNRNETYYHYLFNTQTTKKIVNTLYCIWLIVFNLCVEVQSSFGGLST